MREKKATLADVARKAGVSRTTAAKVLLGTGGDHVRVSDKTCRLVTRTAEVLNYRPNRAAQRLAGGSTSTFGILMDTVNAPVMNDRLAAIEQEASRRGYRLLIGQLHNHTSVLGDYLADFDSHGVDAIFCLFDLTLERNTRLQPLTGQRGDIVYHGMPLRDDGYCVRVDTARAIDMLVSHLFERGCKRIGIELSNPNDRLVMVRREAYGKALSRHGLRLDESLIWSRASEPQPASTAQVEDAVDALVTKGQADAIIATNDLWAVRLIQSLKRRQIGVPERVAVTGYDNLELSTVIEPMLTTIDQDHQAYANAALDLLICAAQRGNARTITIAPRLIVRASSASIS